MIFGYPQFGGDNTSFDFQPFFDNPNVKITDLFSVKEILREVKNSGEVFQRLLLKKPHIIKELVDIALKPEALGVTDVEHSYLACQIIAAQGQFFHDYVFGIVKQNQTEEEDTVKSQENIKGKASQEKLFLYLFSVLDEKGQLNRTVGGYLLRIFSQLHYQSPQKTFEQFANNRQLLNKCISHLDNPSITEILIRIVCSYGQDIIKSQKKAELASIIFSYPFSTEQKGEVVIQMLENLSLFTQELVQKVDQFSLYICEEILSHKILQKVLKSVQYHKQELEVLQQIAQVLSSLCQLYIKEEVKQKKRIKHFSEIEDQTEIKQDRILKPELLSQLSNIAKSIFQYSKGGSCVFSCKLMADISKITNNKQFLFLNKVLFAQYKSLLIKYPHHNILHNEIKKIIIAAFRAKQNQCLSQVIQYINDNHQSQTQLNNQFYHIANAIREECVPKQSINSWQNVKEWRNKVKVTYSTVIPSTNQGLKKTRQLDDFFVNQQQIYSEEDISSEGSPKHGHEVEEDMPDILIHSDDEAQRNLKKKEKQQGLFVVKSAEKIENQDEIQEQIDVINEQTKNKYTSVEDKENDSSVSKESGTKQKKHPNQEQKQSSQKSKSQIDFSKMGPNTFWKKVLTYSLDTLINDLEDA